MTNKLGEKRVRRAFFREGMGLRLTCAVEQRLARQAHNLEVVGSIPTGATQNHRNSLPAQQLTPTRWGCFFSS